VVVFLDGDYSDRPAEFPIILTPIIEGRADITLGSRLSGKSNSGALPWHQSFGNRLAAVFGCFFLANGSITFLCAGSVPVVFALASSVHAFRLDAPDDHLDNQHYSHLLCLAPAHPWTALSVA